LELDDNGMTALLGPTAEELAGAGIEVLWPSSLLGDGLKLQAAVTPTPEKLRRPPRTTMRAIEALGAVLSGSAEIDGEAVTIVAEGPIADLAERVANIAASPAQLGPPPGLVATLRPYQQRGVAWLAAMCDIGFGGCLADDMGLGKTIQVIALHLHRRAADAGPSLVVCPASLLGTWEREVFRFA